MALARKRGGGRRGRWRGLPWRRCRGGAKDTASAGRVLGRSLPILRGFWCTISEICEGRTRRPLRRRPTLLLPRKSVFCHQSTVWGDEAWAGEQQAAEGEAALPSTIQVKGNSFLIVSSRPFLASESQAQKSHQDSQCSPVYHMYVKLRKGTLCACGTWVTLGDIGYVTVRLLINSP